MGPGPQGRWVGNTLADFERDLADNLCYERRTTAESASAQDARWTLAVTVRDRLADRRARTARANNGANPKFVYYLSAEYVPEHQLAAERVVCRHCRAASPGRCRSGYSAGELEDLDVEPGLGNGGLGRLAACLLDSLNSGRPQGWPGCQFGSPNRTPYLGENSPGAGGGPGPEPRHRVIQ